MHFIQEASQWNFILKKCLARSNSYDNLNHTCMFKMSFSIPCIWMIIHEVFFHEHTKTVGCIMLFMPPDRGSGRHIVFVLSVRPKL